MSVLVVGSVAFDTLKTPEGERENILGGSATYFSVAASYFTRVHMVAVVGEDFAKSHFDVLERAGVDTRGVQVAGGKTFRWEGSYLEDINNPETLKTELNVFESFSPKIPKEYEQDRYIFLANIDPLLQGDVLGKVGSPEFVMLDTMNLWIQLKRDVLLKMLGRVDLFVLNEKEAKMLTKQENLIRAAKELLAHGPKHVVIKKGEHGAILVGKDEFFTVPAYPVDRVYDPTGAGDSFAGGFMGYVAKSGKKDKMALRQAMVYGSVMASFAVERFGLENLVTLSREDVAGRYKEFQDMTGVQDPVAGVIQR